jgi:copper chaperone CopZ
MRYGVLAACLLLWFPARAEFKWSEVGIDGLTCSMCAKSVELKVRELPFIDDVKMDLVATTMTVSFKPGKQVNVEEIARAVDDAGFSIGYLTAGYVFDEVEVEDGQCLVTKDGVFSFVRTGHRVLDGEEVLKFVGEKFLPKRELAEWKESLGNPCDESDGTPCFVTVL